LSQIEIQLFDTQGPATDADDLFISVTSSGAEGIYQFNNLAANPDYELRVVVNDSNLPSGASPGTPITLDSPLASGGNVTGQDFGFDLSNAKLYTIEVFNRGAGAADNNSLFLVDNLPPDVIFRNDFFDDTTADPVKFVQDGAGLDWVFDRDVGFATSGPPPANFDACNYTPVSVYDPDVRFVCFAPDGALQGGSPSPSFSVSFRTRIK